MAVSGAAQRVRVQLENDAIVARPSLSGFAELRQTARAGLAVYLDDRHNRPGVRIMSKCRLGHIMLMKTVARMMQWPAAGGHCVLCGLAEVEDVPHFLQRCAALVSCRQRLLGELGTSLPLAGQPGRDLLSQFRAGGALQLSLMLSASPAAVASSSTAMREQWGMAYWMIDKAVKNYLCACWRLRKALLGEVRVEHGRLVHTPSTIPAAPLLAAQAAHLPLQPYMQPSSEWRRFWLAWVPGAGVPRARKRRRKHSTFFCVWSGRQVGVFCGWAACESSVANYPGARFRGYQSLAEAERHFELGPQ